MTDAETVSVVIPNWNKADLLRAALVDLGHQTQPIAQVLVVDNASTDGSVEVAEEAGATIVRLSRNKGFAYAVNRGIEACETDWILILNNDVTFGPDWLQRLMEAATKAKAWFAVGKLKSAANPELLDGTYDAISRGGTAWRCGNGRPDGSVWSQPGEIAFVPLTATLVRRELFAQVGLLDEEFESYLEDVDFGLRCAANHLTGVYVPGAIGYHAGSATLGTWHKATVQRIARNQILLVRKHFRGSPCWPILVGQLLWGSIALRHGAGWAWLRGKLEGFFTRTSICHRWPEIKLAVERSEAEIWSLQKATGFDLYWRLYFALVRN